MLAQRFFRSAFARTQRFYYRSPWPTRIPRTAYRWQRPGHIHQRAFRAINHRHLINSWNTLRVWVQEPLFYYNVAGITLLCGLFYAYYLERVPISNRLRFNMISEHWEQQLAKKLNQEYLDDYKDKILPSDSDEHCAARRVFDRMIPYSGLSQAGWDIIVFDEPDRSAFVLPGGKVFISTGMINYCKNDDEIAAILGHELAHNIAHHSAEGISTNILRIPALYIAELISGMDPELVEIAVDVAFRLPRSRVQEREADYLGLLIMAESGYDPSACLYLWSRWEEIDLQDGPSYMSTHPSHHVRTGNVNSWLRGATKQRLLNDSTDDHFQERYYLKCSFCGLG